MKEPFDTKNLKILLGPHKILSTKSKDVTVFNDNLAELVEKMEFLMQATNGIGLAAPQVGINTNLMIMQLPDQAMSIIINPRIISASGDPVTSSEGCLSFPGIEAEIERYPNIKVEYYNLKKELITAELTGLESICFQHEHDHLLGITTLDRIKNNSKRKAIRNMAEKQKQAAILEKPDLYYSL